jgi:hypothetical protein
MTLLQSVQIRLPSTGPTNIEGSIPVAVVAIMMVVGAGFGHTHQMCESLTMDQVKS